MSNSIGDKAGTHTTQVEALANPQRFGRLSTVYVNGSESTAQTNPRFERGHSNSGSGWIFALAADEWFARSRSITEVLLHQAHKAVSRLRAVLKKKVASSTATEETDCVQSWLNSEQAKEQAAALSAEESAFGQDQVETAAFCVK
jgi:hypothetical protein